MEARSWAEAGGSPCTKKVCFEANLFGARRAPGFGPASHFHDQSPVVECAGGRLQREGTDHVKELSMATYSLVEYADASPEVRAVYDDIMATRKVDWINNFWKAIAHDPVLLKRTWESIKQIMAPGALDSLFKEMIYVAVSVTNGCEYCIASHTASARKQGMTPAMFHELMSVVGMANETNRLVKGYQVEIDEAFTTPLGYD